jgi:5-methylcytosine-specific restriction endonuclease McrA
MTIVYVVAGVIVLAFLLSRSRGSVAKDPKRIFTVNERLAGFARAGNRCEHFNIFGMRCRRTASHGDHHYPYSRGGATTMSNFTALCASHNLRKGSRVPSRLYTNRLERRRSSYFPPGESTSIVWEYRVRQGR